MTNVVSIKTFKKKQAKARVLCKEGHHHWKIFQEKQFDSISGKLVTLYICQYCGKKKSQLL